MTRKLRFLASIGACIVALILGNHRPGLADERAGEPARIADLIEQLDSDSYFAREDAARQLAGAGLPAVAPLASVTEGHGLEMTARALDILGKLSTSDDPDTIAAAESALDRLARSENRSVAARAEAALQPRNAARRVAAIERLARCGAQVIMREGRLSELELAEQWTGEPEDLELLRWLVDVQSLIVRDVELSAGVMRHISRMQELVAIELNGTKLTNEGLAHLDELPNLVIVQLINVDITDDAAAHLQQLKSQFARVALFGTRITRDAAEKLRVARPDLTIDHRDGALLGVMGLAHQDGCIIETVRPGTAAFEAGIQLGDIITHFDDQPVNDFAELTSKIARKKPGDKVTLKLRRGLENIDCEVTLGSW